MVGHERAQLCAPCVSAAIDVENVDLLQTVRTLRASGEAWCYPNTCTVCHEPRLVVGRRSPDAPARLPRVPRLR
jgi:hypothetical protein